MREPREQCEEQDRGLADLPELAGQAKSMALEHLRKYGKNGRSTCSAAELLNKCYWVRTRSS